MNTTDIKSWLTYWGNARMVAVDQIAAFDQVHLARKFCQCMRVGVFHPDLVTDLQIWRALSEMRQEATKARGGSDCRPIDLSSLHPAMADAVRPFIQGAV